MRKTILCVFDCQPANEKIERSGISDIKNSNIAVKKTELVLNVCLTRGVKSPIKKTVMLPAIVKKPDENCDKSIATAVIRDNCEKTRKAIINSSLNQTPVSSFRRAINSKDRLKRFIKITEHIPKKMPRK